MFPHIDHIHLPHRTPIQACRCSACGITKPVADFHSNGGTRRRSACKACEGDRAKVKRLKAASTRPPVVRLQPISRHPLYGIWSGMHGRCRDLSDPNYGGRGITVCERWSDFETFVADMGLRPSPAHSIDRADVNGPYSPANCQWATPAEQNMNKRNTLLLNFAGRELPLVQWSRIMDVSPALVAERKAAGWDDTKALTEHPGPAPGVKGQPIAHAGRRQHADEWAHELGMSRTGLRGRIAAGWPLERALSQPLGFENQPAARVRTGMTPDTQLTFDGRTQAAAGWVEEMRGPLRMTYAALRGRLELGWSVERALTTVVREHRPRKAKAVRQAPPEFVGPRRPRGRPRKS
nr:hypothetical protein [Variovorax boronicumulans]